MSQQVSKNGRISHLIFFMLTITLGMQALRIFTPLLFYILTDNLGRTANTAGLLAFVVFATSFLISSLHQRFGLTRMWRTSALLLGPLLILNNLFFNLISANTSPLITLFPLFLTMVAVAAFLQFLAHYILYHSDDMPFIIIGLLGGLGADLSIHGIAGTYDLVWHQLAWLTVLVALQLLFMLASTNFFAASDKAINVGWRWSLVVIGPYLFLQMLIFQNVARLTAVTNTPYHTVVGRLALGHYLGLGAAYLILKYPRFTKLSWGLASILFILGTTNVFTGKLIIGQHIFGQIGGAVLLALTLMQLQPQKNGKSWQTAVALPYGLGLLLNVTLIFTYYIGYQIPMPFTNTLLPAIAAIFISLIALITLLKYPTYPPMPTESLLITPFYIITFILIFNTRLEGNSQPVHNNIRIMTYNLHNGFHPYGYLDLEAIAQVIENEEADIVALQEVSRGWIVNGSVDMLTWLSHRLDMPYIFNPTADPLWGNALLSRYPITHYQLLPLPPDNLPLTRGFIAAEVNIGNGQTLNIIATHLHHVSSGSEIRQQQAQTIIDYAQNTPRTIIMGDLNAEPDTPEMRLFSSAGYTDILANEQPNFTFYALNPDRQIDYIWLTPDLTADLITIPPILASDHLGIATTIHP